MFSAVIYAAALLFASIAAAQNTGYVSTSTLRLRSKYPLRVLNPRFVEHLVQYIAGIQRIIRGGQITQQHIAIRQSEGM